MLSRGEKGLENRPTGPHIVLPKIPLIRYAFIYRKAVISLVSYTRNEGSDSSSYGYSNRNGTLYRYDKKKQPKACGDRTFIELLRSIYPTEFWHRGLTNSPAISTSKDGDVFGTTDVLTGEDLPW